MKTRKYLSVALGAILIALVLIISCKKDSQLKTYTTNAIIRNMGDQAADGCGWQLIADSTYHPLNLPVQYQVDSLKVAVTYHKPGSRFYCGMIILDLIARPGLSEIIIDRIQTKQ